MLSQVVTTNTIFTMNILRSSILRQSPKATGQAAAITPSGASWKGLGCFSVVGIDKPFKETIRYLGLSELTGPCIAEIQLSPADVALIPVELHILLILVTPGQDRMVCAWKIFRGLSLHHIGIS